MRFRDSLISSAQQEEDVHVHVHLDDASAPQGAPDDVEASIERYFARHGLGEPPHVTQRRLRDEARCCAGERTSDSSYRSSMGHAGAGTRIRQTNLEDLIAEIWSKLTPGGK